LGLGFGAGKIRIKLKSGLLLGSMDLYGRSGYVDIVPLSAT